MAKTERESKDTSSRKRKVEPTTPDWFPPPKKQKNHHKNDIFPENLEHYFDDIRPEDLPLYTSLSLMSLMNYFAMWEVESSEGSEFFDDNFDPNEIDLDDEDLMSFPEFVDSKEKSAAYGSRIAARLVTETAKGQEAKIAVNAPQARMLSNFFSVDLTDAKKRYRALVQLIDKNGNIVEQFDVPLERRSVYATNYGTVFISTSLAEKKGDHTLEIINVYSDTQTLDLDEELTNDKS